MCLNNAYYCAASDLIKEWIFPEDKNRSDVEIRLGYKDVNPFTVGNLLFWENFLLPECLQDSIVWRWTKFILAIDDQS